MTANEAISSWEKIQQGVKEAETLMEKGNTTYPWSRQGRPWNSWFIVCVTRPVLWNQICHAPLTLFIMNGSSPRPPVNTTTKSACSATLLSMKIIPVLTMPTRLISFCPRRFTPSPMTTVQANAAVCRIQEPFLSDRTPHLWQLQKPQEKLRQPFLFH